MQIAWQLTPICRRCVYKPVRAPELPKSTSAGKLDLRLDTRIRTDHSLLGRLQRIFMYRFWQQRFFALVAGLVTALLLWKVFKASYWEALGLGTLVFVGSLRFVGGIAPDPTIMPLYSPGTPIIAIKRFASIADGTPGIILELTPYRHWGRWRLAYQCVFAGNVRAAARPHEIERRDHGYTLFDLERTDLAGAPKMGHVGKATA